MGIKRLNITEQTVTIRKIKDMEYFVIETLADDLFVGGELCVSFKELIAIHDLIEKMAVE